MRSKTPDLAVVDTAYDATRRDGKVVTYRDRKPNPYYKVWLRLVGSHLPLVDKVVYSLHPSFSPQQQEVYRTVANPECELVIWTWGVFEVQAEVLDKLGNRYGLTYQLQYDREFKDPEIKFEQERVTTVPRAALRSPRL